MYSRNMARNRTTADVFNAIGDEHRRTILDTIGARELAVGEIVTTLGLTQPQVSKHLKVLREVGLVQCTRTGRHRHYREGGRGGGAGHTPPPRPAPAPPG